MSHAHVSQTFLAIRIIYTKGKVLGPELEQGIFRAFIIMSQWILLSYIT